MKATFTIFIFLIFCNTVVAQNKIPGKYRDNFGCSIILNSDSTFNFKWRFDLAVSWSKGTWTVINDTVFFTITPVFDTLRYLKNKSTIDSLVFSLDTIPEIITMEDYAMTKITSGGQNDFIMPDKLYFKNDRLYSINKKGKLITKRVEAFMIHKKVVPWYIKK